MKNTNKKGFTLVELVIVIAVIAILAGVLIGTFSTVLTRANQSKALQQLKSTIDEAYIEYVADNQQMPTELYKVGTTFTFIAPTSGSYTTYTLYKAAVADDPLTTSVDETAAEVTKTFVVLDEKNNTYLVWDANSGYQVQTLNEAPTGYTLATTSTNS